jgi:hypothetical protein
MSTKSTCPNTQSSNLTNPNNNASKTSQLSGSATPGSKKHKDNNNNKK